MNENDTLKKLNDLGEDWDGLSKEERIDRLERILHEEKNEPEEIEIPLEDKIALARLGIASLLIINLTREHMPIPYNTVDYYNDQLRILSGLSDETIGECAELFEKNVRNLEEPLVSRIENGEDVFEDKSE